MIGGKIMILSPEFLYMVEHYGGIDTREGKINRAIQMLIKSKNPNVDQYDIYKECGLDWKTFTDKEIRRIEYHVQKGVY